MAKMLRIVNIALLIIAAFLLMTWVFSGSITGLMAYSLDSSEPRCVFSPADGEDRVIENLDLCCLEVQKMLKCERTSGDFDHVCYNLKEGNNYNLNSKAFNYCLKEGYEVQKAY